ncbi:MAG: TraR/DksA family transcriptional regulator [Parcubacteria group bacterium Gr01-1014_2]|nr:MAG: TraR/DksA family transcriptional regulator [Parcubacteria group bacterium Gr01-1014_2]
MEQKQLEQLKKSLIEEKNRIEKDLGEIGQKNPKVEGNFDVRFPHYGQGKDENAQGVAEFEKNKALEANLEKRLNEINETLKKIEKDDYGVCQNCSSKIEGPRLKAMPTAALCVSCAKIQK